MMASGPIVIGRSLLATAELQDMVRDRVGTMGLEGFLLGAGMLQCQSRLIDGRHVTSDRVLGFDQSLMHASRLLRRQGRKTGVNRFLADWREALSQVLTAVACGGVFLGSSEHLLLLGKLRCRDINAVQRPLPSRLQCIVEATQVDAVHGLAPTSATLRKDCQLVFEATPPSVC
jgi:hypothetical protein